MTTITIDEATITELTREEMEALRAHMPPCEVPTPTPEDQEKKCGNPYACRCHHCSKALCHRHCVNSTHSDLIVLCPDCQVAERLQSLQPW